MEDVTFVSFAYRRVWNGNPGVRDGSLSAPGLSKLEGSRLQYDTPCSFYTVPSEDGVDTLPARHLYAQGAQALSEVHPVCVHRTLWSLSPS